MRLRTAAWLLPGAYLLHVAEEAPGFAAWARRHGSPRYTQRDFWSVNGLGLALTLAATALALRSRDRRLLAAWHAGLVSQQLVWNTVFHVATTAAYGEYSPGLFSAVATFPALWLLVTRAALRERGIGRATVARGVVAGGAIHALAVARQVYGIGSSGPSSSRRQTS